MKVKVFVRKYNDSDWIEDETVKRLLLNNRIYSFWTYQEEILDVDISEIINKKNSLTGYEAGYIYCNKLYDIVHSKSIFKISDDNDIEYEIIEDGYPEDIPYAHCEFDNEADFHKWMLEEGEKERVLMAEEELGSDEYVNYNDVEFPLRARFKMDENTIYLVTGFEDGEEIEYSGRVLIPSSNAKGYRMYKNSNGRECMVHFKDLEAL